MKKSRKNVTVSIKDILNTVSEEDLLKALYRRAGIEIMELPIAGDSTYLIGLMEEYADEAARLLAKLYPNKYKAFDEKTSRMKTDMEESK